MKTYRIMFYGDIPFITISEDELENVLDSLKYGDEFKFIEVTDVFQTPCKAYFRGLDVRTIVELPSS